MSPFKLLLDCENLSVWFQRLLGNIIGLCKVSMASKDFKWLPVGFNAPVKLQVFQKFLKLSKGIKASLSLYDLADASMISVSVQWFLLIR